MLPKGANILDLLWTYNIKDDGTLKARCVCNGRPTNKNTANVIVQGADASNAFAEADAPKIPLFVLIDQPYRDWWYITILIRNYQITMSYQSRKHYKDIQSHLEHGHH